MHLTKRLIEQIKEETKQASDDDEKSEINSQFSNKRKLNKSLDYVINFLVDKKLKYSSCKQKDLDLDLSNKQIVSIDSNAFEGLNLKRVNLASNKLTHLDAHIFDGLTNLKEVNLSSNRLNSLDPMLFKKFKKNKRNRVKSALADVVHSKKKNKTILLTHIDLQNNEIQTIDDKMFTDLINLEYLNLKGNKLSSIEVNLFQGLTNLNYIDFSFNQISYLDENIFKELVNLKYLDLSRNQLKSINANTFSNLKCLEAINLSNNEIDSLESGLFDSLFNLKLINLAHNKLKKLDDSNLFRDLLNLETINLEFNSIVSIRETIFSGLHNLKEIKLYHNYLDSISEKIFKGLSSVEYLYLSFNRINFIHWKAFRDLKRLKILHLSFNQLKTINSRLFRGVASVNEIYLDHNFITRVQNDTFKNLNYLNKLYLGNNLIKNLDPQSLAKIKYLDLEENYLSNECQTMLTNSLIKNKILFKKQKKLINKIENNKDKQCNKLDQLNESNNKNLNEEGDLNDEFYDASDSLDVSTNDSKLEKKLKELDFRIEMPDLIPSVVVKHRLSDEIDKIVKRHLETDLDDDFNKWELLASDGDMKIYRRDLEENGIVIDPLKAVHIVKGITAHEMCKYFFDEEVRLEWDLTVEKMKVVERLSSDTSIFHQVVKRVWPSAQRDTCFWSHIRPFSLNKTPKDESNITSDWIVVNYSTTHDLAPLKDGIVRAYANVAMICSTIITNKSKFKNPSSLDRKDIMCKINYVSQLNPGGWVPAKALRAVYKSVYPKFVKGFSEYVINKTANKPILY